MRMFGAGSEATGGHCKGGNFDDIIGNNTIEDSGMPKIRRWMGNTARNVLRTDCGWPRGRGTHWDVDDIYVDWKKSRNWQVITRACYETDGTPDWEGEPVLYTREVIESKRREMSRFSFSCQMMNDPLPDTERMWDAASETYCTMKEAAEGNGRVFVLSDPAPKGSGSLSGVGEKQRGDGSGDWWSIAVVRLRVNGSRLQAILLHGEHSRDWTPRAGLDAAAQLMSTWGTNLFFNESYGGLGADYTEEMIRVCDEKGITRPHLEKVGKAWKLPKFDDSHASGAKNLRFESLCDWMRRGDFLICESVPDAFLHGDGDKVGLLPQGRNWRALPKGRNTLKWDDDADVTARCTDTALRRFAPKPSSLLMGGWNPLDVEEQDMDPGRSRYCGI